MYRDFARTSNRLKGEKDVSGFERSSEGIGVFQMVDPFRAINSNEKYAAKRGAGRMRGSMALRSRKKAEAANNHDSRSEPCALIR